MVIEYISPPSAPGQSELTVIAPETLDVAETEV